MLSFRIGSHSTQSCCMLSFRIGSLGRASEFKQWHVHWHQHCSTNASSSQSFAVRDSALCVCSLRLCKALPTGCDDIFSRDVLAHYSEPVRLRAAGMKPLLISSRICTGLQCLGPYLRYRLPRGIRRCVSALSRFTLQAKSFRDSPHVAFATARFQHIPRRVVAC